LRVNPLLVVRQPEKNTQRSFSLARKTLGVHDPRDVGANPTGNIGFQPKKIKQGEIPLKDFIKILHSADLGSTGAEQTASATQTEAEDVAGNEADPETPKTYTQEELDKLIAAQKAEVEENLKKEQAAALEQERKAKELEQMSEDERRETELAELSKKLAEAEEKSARLENTREVQALFAENELPITFLPFFETQMADKELVLATVADFAKVWKSEHEKAAKNFWKGQVNPPKTPENNAKAKNTGEKLAGKKLKKAKNTFFEEKN
jgi:hypothetical protein